MNHKGHSDLGGLLFFLLLVIYMVAALLEGTLLVLFVFATFKWNLWLLSVLLGLAAVIFPVVLAKRFPGFFGG